MRTTLVVISMVVAALLAGSAALKLSHRPAAVESYRKAGVPESWLNGLASLLLLAAAGLVVGLWWPIARRTTRAHALTRVCLRRRDGRSLQLAAH